MAKQHIATAAIYGGFTGSRVGTRRLYTEEEIDEYLRELKAIGKPAHLRRVRDTR